MKTKQVFLYGYQGNIVRLLDASVKKPLIELDNNFLSEYDKLGEFYLSSACELDFLELKIELADIYRDWGRFGYMGDVIAVKSININFNWVYTISFIGRLAIHKPGLACDLLPIFKIGPEEFYFVGVKRKYEPGKGLAALMGGFMDVKGYHFETPIETIIHEAEEEIGLKINVLLHPKSLLDNLPKMAPVVIDYEDPDSKKKIEFYSQLMFYGTVQTGDNEKLINLGLKRVYQTHVYYMMVEMSDMGITEEKLRRWLRAGDDAAELIFANIKSDHDLRFGLTHHQKVFDAVIKSFN